MRIAFLLFSLDAAAGTERAVVTQADALVSLGQDAEIVSVLRTAEAPHFAIDPRVGVRHLLDARPERVEAGDVAGLDAPSRLVPPAWDAQFSLATDAPLAEALRSLDADVVVSTTPALLAVAAQLLPPQVALVHQEHRSSSNRRGGMEPLLAFAPRADVVALLTDDMATWLRATLGPVSPEVVTIPNALPPGYAPRSRLDQPLIVTAGRLAVEKQWPRLVSAFAEVADELPGWRLRIFGDGAARLGLVRIIRRTGLYDRVELPGLTPDIRAELATASICALTSDGEAFPTIVQEAMAAGVPVVSMDCASGPRALITHGVDGLLVTPESIAGMAAALHRLATDVELRQRLGAAARSGSEKYDAERIAREWVGVFERAVARRRGGEVGSTPLDRPESPRVPPGLTPAQARRDALTAATTAAGRAGGEWFVIPARAGSPAVVVVPEEQRESFLTALPDITPAHLRIRQPARYGWPERHGPVAEQCADLGRGRLPGFVLEPWPDDDDSGRPSVLAQGCAVEVELWDRRVDGELSAPWRNRYTWRVPPGAVTATVEVDGVTCPTLPLMTEPTVTDVTYPVDVVYTWVDGSDPAWEAERVRRLAEATGMAASPESSGRARYDDRDELRHSLRSIHLFAPWVRTVHVVTAGQTPDWLDTSHPKIHLVDHREILPADALPTFNSQAIETALHRIPGLAEHFLYLNDDCFLGRPVPPELFFDAAGRFAAFLDRAPVGLGDRADLPSYLKAAATNRRLIEGAFGVVTTHTMAHAAYPLRISTVAEVAERFAPEWEATAHSPFRGEHDVAPLSSLAQHYGLLTGAAFVGSAVDEFLDLSRRRVQLQLESMLDRQQDFFCLGDQHDYALAPGRMRVVLAEFLAAYFPIPAPWER